MSSGARDWDANWLVIDISVRSEDGRACSLRAPCLTTWEAAALGRWLWAVAAGAVAPADPGRPARALDGPPPEGLLVFTEPTVALSLASQDREQVVLRLALATPAGPCAVQPEAIEHVTTVQMSRSDLVAAVEVWDRELTAFPVR